VIDIASRFPEHRIAYVVAHHTERYAKGHGTVEWHKDRDFNGHGSGRVTVVATVLGPSTMYKFKSKEQDVFTEMHLPDGVLAGHTDKVTHASPSKVIPQGRLAIVIDFVRKK
jgi:hypothetical protein